MAHTTTHSSFGCRQRNLKMFLAGITLFTLGVIIVLTQWNNLNIGSLVRKIFGGGEKVVNLRESRELATRIMKIYYKLENTISRNMTLRHSDIVDITRLANEIYPFIGEASMKTNNSGNNDSNGHGILSFLMEDILKEMKLPDNVTVVCPEVYLGARAGLGWKVENCTAPVSLNDLLTIVINVVKYPPDAAEKKVVQLLKDFHSAYPRMSVVVVGFRETPALKKWLTTLGAEKTVTFDRPTITWRHRDWSTGYDQVKTPFILVARDIFRFSKEASPLDRMLRVLTETPGVAVVGGAVRNSSRHWKVGCFQTKLSNYVLRYSKGYHHSHSECMFCDYVDGPFISYTTVLQNSDAFNSNSGSSMEFLNFFLELSAAYPSMACPDVMFYADAPMADGAEVLEKNTWLPLAKKLELNRVLIEYERSHALHKFTCHDVGIDCGEKFLHTFSYAIPVCCQEEVAKAYKLLDDFCRYHQVSSRFGSGVVLGSVKMSDIMPWDIDGDFDFQNENYSFFLDSRPLFEKNGMIYTNLESPVKGLPSFFKLWTPSMFIEMYGETNFAFDDFLYSFDQNSSIPTWDMHTRMKVHDIWVNGPPNPGQYARSRYGPECLKHANSWRHSGMSSSWALYRPGFFNTCDDPSKHACLDKFPADGSFGFRVPEL